MLGRISSLIYSEVTLSNYLRELDILPEAETDGPLYHSKYIHLMTLRTNPRYLIIACEIIKGQGFSLLSR